MDDFLRRIELHYPFASSASCPRVRARRLIALFLRFGENIHEHHPQLIDAVHQVRDGFAGLRIPSSVPVGAMSLELVNALCATEVTWDLLEFQAGRMDFSYGLYRWCECFPQDGHRTELEHLRKHSKLSLWLHKAVASLDLERTAAAMMAHKGSRDLLSDYLTKAAEERERCRGSVPRLAWLAQNKLSTLAFPTLLDFRPDTMQQMLRFDAASEFANAVRFGFASELSWPALERCIERLSEGSGAGSLGLWESWPEVAVAADNCIEFMNGDTVTKHIEFPFIAGEIMSIRAVNEQVTVCVRLGEQPFVCWLGSSDFQLAGAAKDFPHRYSILCGDYRLTGAGILHPQGDPIWHVGGQVLIGKNFALLPIKGNKFAVWDIAARARADNIPASAKPLELLEYLGVSGWVKNALGDAFDWSNVRLVAQDSTVITSVPETSLSPLGKVGDRHIDVVLEDDDGRTIISPFGVFTSNNKVCAVVMRPGGGYWFTDGTKLFDAVTDLPLMPSFDAAGARSYVSSYLPLAGWHQLRPRDASTSESMRHYTAEQAAEVLQALVHEPGRVVGYSATNEDGWRGSVETEVDSTTTWNLREDSPALAVLRQQFRGAPLEILAAIVHAAADIQTLDSYFENLRVCAGFEPRPIAQVRIRELSDIATDMLDYLSGMAGGRFSVEQVNKASESLARVLQHPSQLDEHLVYVSLFYFIGRERLLISLLLSPMLRNEVVCDLARALQTFVTAGIFSGRFANVGVPLEGLEAPCVIGDCIVLEADMGGAQVLAPAQTVEAQEVLDEFGLSQTEFAECLRELERRPISTAEQLESEIETLWVATSWSPAAIRWLLGGKPLSGDLQVIAQAQLGDAPFRDHRVILAAGVEPGRAVDSIFRGRNIDRMAEAWQEMYGPPLVHFSDEEYAKLHHLFGPEVCAQIWRPIGNCPTLELLGAVLLLISWRRSDDPERAFLCEQVQEMREKVVDKPADLPDEFQFGKTPMPDIEANMNSGWGLLQEGHLNLVLLEASRQYATRQGHPYNPLVSAPELVADVCEQFGISTEAAQYYLQIIALADPSDANICAWNGWQPGMLPVLAAELTDHLVQADHPGTNRSYFRPGVWLEGDGNCVGIEQSKAPLYALSVEPTMRPVIPGCPPLMPLGQLFHAAWRQSQSF
ncbi:MAG: hypothetical protein Q4A92_08550 [Corynebacterium sp.]|nr:hypothetical protein [Corynebacterium sp.]